MRPVFINSAASVTGQNTSDPDFLNPVIQQTTPTAPAVNQNYKAYIPPAMARRMAKGIKMGIFASRMALEKANLEQEAIDAIITGTGLGCVRDSEKFVSSIIDNEEEYLTPTPFIQSTHNTVAGQIALNMNCKGYNMTYVNGSSSFEAALMDAQMQLEAEEAQTILVGGVDELGEHTTQLHTLVGHVKKEPIDSLSLLESKTPGTLLGEGAHFFTLSTTQQKTSMARLVAIATFNTLEERKIEEFALQFLADHQLTPDNIDTLVLGNNGDIRHDSYYKALTSGSLQHCEQIYYKHLCGEHFTASGFGLWLATHYLSGNSLPDSCFLKKRKTSPKHVLLYNQYQGKDHTFTLLQAC